ncbi:MAG: hypothetical protein E6767_09845 [Dysgonomonas sp.]|nr:hypothetical protein [Dysgonomonas sp.]
MKKYLLILSVFLVTSFLNAQTENNPFSKFGYDVLVATSSKGEFEEFHDRRDIVEIGSVLYNTKTKQIVKVLDKDSTTIDISAATAAMSVDPLCEKYYWISPYVYCANNPIKYIDPTGMWYNDANEKEAQKQEKALNKLYTDLYKQAWKIEAKGGDASDVYARIGEISNSINDILDMRNNADTEFRYAKASNKDNPAGKDNPTIDGLGTSVVTMYVEGNMGSKAHEGRHGGDVARGTLTLANYNVNHEVSAYQAQYGATGNINYIQVNELNQRLAYNTGIQPPISQINNMNAITPAFVNSIGTMTYVPLPNGRTQPGLMRLYPPKVWDGTRWLTISPTQWDR